MVKASKSETLETSPAIVAAATVCLDPSKPIARQYEWEGLLKSITVPDNTISLTQMVLTGVVAPGSGRGYNFPDIEEDDELAHEHPDYQKLNSSDMVEREMFAESFIQNPNNYEKNEETSSGTNLTEEQAKGASGASE